MLPEGIDRIALPTPFQIGDVNTWLLRGEPLTLVDAGPLMEETEARLEDGLAALGLAVEDLELIFLTHQHADHVGLAGELRRRSGAEVAGTAALAAFLADTDASLDADDAYSVALMRRHGVSETTVETLRGISRAFRLFVGDVRVARVLADGDELVAGGRTWRVRERPGHSPTDTVLTSDGVLVAGDHLLDPISPAVGLYPDSRPDPLADYLASLERTIELAPRLALTGHGEPIRDPVGRARALIEHHRFRLAETVAALERTPQSGSELSFALFGQDLAPAARRFAVAETLSHLERVVAEGGAERGRTSGTVTYTAS
jgi:glyoxylase-like metal-dependent hydrolase (beta-lactamase superfamily II)